MNWLIQGIVEDLIDKSVMKGEFRKVECDAMELVSQMRYEALKMRKSIKPERLLVSRVGNYQLRTGEGRNLKIRAVNLENVVNVKRVGKGMRKFHDVGRLILSFCDTEDYYSPMVRKSVEYTDEVSFYNGLATLMGEFGKGLDWVSQ